MMKFLDRKTGNVLETSSEVVAEQYKKYTDRYEVADKSGRFAALEKKRQKQEKETNENQ